MLIFKSHRAACVYWCVLVQSKSEISVNSTGGISNDRNIRTLVSIQNQDWSGRFNCCRRRCRNCSRCCLGTLVVVAGTPIRTVLRTWTIKNVFVKNACACCKAKEIGFITTKNTITILVFKVVQTSEIRRTGFIIVTFAKGRRAIFTSRGTSRGTRTIVNTINTFETTVKFTRRIAIALDKALLPDFIAVSGAFFY